MSAKSPVPPGVTAHLNGRLLAYLRDNPGTHRARDVAQALGVPGGVRPTDWSQHVANALGTLVRRTQDVERVEVQLEGWKKPVGMYAATHEETSPAVSSQTVT